MSDPATSEGFWARIKSSRIVQVLVAYLAVSWGVLQVTEVLKEAFEWPAGVLQLALLLLGIGLVIIAATAWVQSHPLTAARAARDEVPDAWELEAGGITKELSHGRLPHLNWARALLGGVVAFSLLFGFAGLYVVIKDRGQSFAPTEAIAEAGPALAVLPFSVTGAELQEWREGMVNLLSTNLDGAAGLRAISSRTVLARWDELVGAGGRVDQPTSLRVAQAAGARYALLGTAVGIGPRVRLTADVYDVASGAVLGQVRAEGSPDSVLALVDDLSIAVIGAVMERGELPALDLASITTHSIPALKAYLEGESLFRRANFGGAIDAYERAVAADSTFARAYYRLAEAHDWFGIIGNPLAVQNRRRAVAFIDRLPEREALLVRAVDAFGTQTGLELARQAVRRYPDDPEAWYLLGDLYFHYRDLSLASLEDADHALSQAVALAPHFAPYRIHTVDLAFMIADSALASQRQAELERFGASAGRHVRRGRMLLTLAYGDSGEVAAVSRLLDTLSVQELRPAAGPRDARLWWVQEEILEALKRRGELNSWQHGGRASLSLQHGALGQALERLADPEVPGWVRTCYAALWHYRELPIPEERLAAALDAAAVDTASRWGVACAAVSAADRGRWEDHAGLVARLETMAAAFEDSSEVRWTAAAARFARGFGEWKRGQPESGFELMESARRDGYVVNVEMLGDVQMELGNWSEAVRYYRANWVNPLIRLKLARVYELLGERDKARDAYAYFVQAWADAEPELQPIVERAKQAMLKLRGDSPG